MAGAGIFKTAAPIIDTVDLVVLVSEKLRDGIR